MFRIIFDGMSTIIESDDSQATNLVYKKHPIYDTTGVVVQKLAYLLILRRAVKRKLWVFSPKWRSTAAHVGLCVTEDLWGVGYNRKMQDWLLNDTREVLSLKACPLETSSVPFRRDRFVFGWIYRLLTRLDILDGITTRRTHTVWVGGMCD